MCVNGVLDSGVWEFHKLFFNLIFNVSFFPAEVPVTDDTRPWEKAIYILNDAAKCLIGTNPPTPAIQRHPKVIEKQSSQSRAHFASPTLLTQGRMEEKQALTTNEPNDDELNDISQMGYAFTPIPTILPSHNPLLRQYSPLQVPSSPMLAESSPSVDPRHLSISPRPGPIWGPMETVFPPLPGVHHSSNSVEPLQHNTTLASVPGSLNMVLVSNRARLQAEEQGPNSRDEDKGGDAPKTPVPSTSTKSLERLDVQSQLAHLTISGETAMPAPQSDKMQDAEKLVPEPRTMPADEEPSHLGNVMSIDVRLPAESQEPPITGAVALSSTVSNHTRAAMLPEQGTDKKGKGKPMKLVHFVPDRQTRSKTQGANVQRESQLWSKTLVLSLRSTLTFRAIVQNFTLPAAWQE